MDHLRKISPIRHAEAVRLPTLLLHGVEGTQVLQEIETFLAASLKPQ